MQPFSKRRRALNALSSAHHEDPLGGVASLFDASIVFAVGLMVALVQAFSPTQLFNPSSEFTIVTKDARTGQMEIVEKTTREIKVQRVTPEQTAGEGRGARTPALGLTHERHVS